MNERGTQTARGDRDWELYAAHRARLTDVIVQSGKSDDAGRLCVLGAGACNDLDLARAAEVFSEIHLVDLDEKALMRGVARHEAPVRAKLNRHALDLSGLSTRRLARWRRAPPDAAELEQVSAETLDAICDRLPGPFDVVASTCVLTQMAFALREALGERHPALETLRFALMRTHLSSLVALTAPGGAAVFASDLVSSSTFPLDSDRDLVDVMGEVVASGAGYYAANPEVVATILSHAGTPEFLPPWLWTGPLDRTYLVYALRLSVPSPDPD
jgi:hypothetical protein